MNSKEVAKLNEDGSRSLDEKRKIERGIAGEVYSMAGMLFIIIIFFRFEVT